MKLSAIECSSLMCQKWPAVLGTRLKKIHSFIHCTILNANQRTKTGEHWEQGYPLLMFQHGMSGQCLWSPDYLKLLLINCHGNITQANVWTHQLPNSQITQLQAGFRKRMKVTSFRVQEKKNHSSNQKSFQEGLEFRYPHCQKHIYCIAVKFDRELNLAVWWSELKLPN